MRQIFDLNASLENVGDYAFIDVRKGDESEIILAFRYNESNWAFYGNNHRILGGSIAPRFDSVLNRFPFLRFYSSSWVLHTETLQNGLGTIEIDHAFLISTPIDLESGCVQETEELTESTSVVEASNFISRNYEQNRLYSGLWGYHAHHGQTMNNPNRPYRGHRIGIELEVEFNSEDEKDDFSDKESNWFYLERDGSLGNHGVEIITIPLLPKDAKSIEFWSVLTDSIKSHARSWDTGRCGLHIHMGREILGRNEEQQSETIGKLLYLYHHYVKDTRMNTKIYGRERGYHDQDGKTSMGNAAKMLGSEVLKTKSVIDKVKTAMIDRSNDDRYFDINLQNSKTIEFRKGKGSINPYRIVMVVDYCERMCIYAKNTPWQQIGYDDFVAFLKSTVDNVELKNIIETWS